MGCGGSEEKKEQAVTVEDGGKTTMAPLIITVTNTWNEGVTKEQVVEQLNKVQEVAMSTPGILCFQYAMDEEKRTNHVTEVHAEASDIGPFFEKLGDPAEAFSSITTTETIACGPQAQLDAAAGAFAAFTPAMFVTDGVGGAVSMPTAASGADQPLIMTVQNKWREGETLESVTACLKAVQEKALTIDGIYCFQYAIDAEKKLNQVTEIYKDASVIGPFFEALGDPAEAFKAIETTSTICAGPKEQVEAASGALSAFSPQIYYSDPFGAACKGFGSN